MTERLIIFPLLTKGRPREYYNHCERRVVLTVKAAFIPKKQDISRHWNFDFYELKSIIIEGLTYFTLCVL